VSDVGLLDVGCHWLDFTTRAPVDEVLTVLDGFLGEFNAAEYGTKLYEVLWLGPLDSRVEASPRRGSSDHCRVSLPGEVCDRLQLQQLVALVTLLQGRPTRVDLAVDGAPFHPNALQAAWDADLVLSNVHRGNPESNIYQRNSEGVTVYIGSPKADARLRCYNRRGPTRVELQLRRAKARSFWRELCASSVEAFPSLVLGAVDGFVSFRAPTGEDSNRSRWKRLPLWEAFLCGAARVRLAVVRAPASLDRLARHVWRQAAPLTTWLHARQVQGFDLWDSLSALLEHGRERMGPRHRSVLAGLTSAVPM